MAKAERTLEDYFRWANCDPELENQLTNAVKVASGEFTSQLAALAFDIDAPQVDGRGL